MLYNYNIAVIVCQDIPNPTHGRINFYPDELAFFDFLTNATYVCDFGYGLRGNTVVRQCNVGGVGAFGIWTGFAPTCEGVLHVK